MDNSIRYGKTVGTRSITVSGIKTESRLPIKEPIAARAAGIKTQLQFTKIAVEFLSHNKF